jgi:hypothetical protein
MNFVSYLICKHVVIFKNDVVGSLYLLCTLEENMQMPNVMTLALGL